MIKERVPFANKAVPTRRKTVPVIKKVVLVAIKRVPFKNEIVPVAGKPVAVKNKRVPVRVVADLKAKPVKSGCHFLRRSDSELLLFGSISSCKQEIVFLFLAPECHYIPFPRLSES